MVTIVDKTDERRKENEKRVLERDLMIECFSEKVISELPGGYTFYVLENNDRPKILAEKLFGTIHLYVYDKSVLKQAKDFAEKYEDKFSFDGFIIETNYSGFRHDPLSS